MMIIEIRLTEEKNNFYACNRLTKRNSPFEGGVRTTFAENDA
jgi:hypothetical protein